MVLKITWTSVGGSSVARCGVADSKHSCLEILVVFNWITMDGSWYWYKLCKCKRIQVYWYRKLSGYLPAFAAGDVMGIILDRDNNTVKLYKWVLVEV